MNGKAGDIIKLQRSSAYWIGRATRQRKAGNRRRAAALLRHALVLTPQDAQLRMQYAKTLQEMECYEASNRAAFSALMQNPRHFACYGVIGRNMLALGHDQEAMDAFSRYLLAVRRSGSEPEYDAELDALEASETDRHAMRARHEALLNIAGKKLTRGNLKGAERALALAKPASEVDERYHCLQTVLLQLQGETAAAVQNGERACASYPHSVRARCVLAGAYHDAGLRAKAAAALLAATLRCQNPQDDQLVSNTATSLGFAELALCVLRRSLKQSPERLPAVYDLCVTLLKLGRLDDAEPLMHVCRDLDPADVPARSMHRTMAQWHELALTPAQVKVAARALPFYPMISPAQSNELLAQLAHALSEGIEAFGRKLMEDDNLFALLLYALGDAQHQLARLVPLLVNTLPRSFAERMLREILVLHTQDDTVKRYAAAALIKMGARPPFVVWHGGRIAEIDPSVSMGQDATFARMMLLRRMADIQHQTGDARLMTHALHLLKRMSKARREDVVRDENGIFRTALEQHYLLTYGLPDTRRLHRLLRYTADERRHVRAVFSLFCRLLPLPARVPRTQSPLPQLLR